MSTHRWTLERDWKSKRQGQVWIVRDSSGNRGYFKFARKDQWYYSGPLVANEYIAAALAKQLGFPVADLEWAEVDGPERRSERGVVSRAAGAWEVITWREADSRVRQDPAKYVNRFGQLRQLIVFDAWIANLDRASGKNLILYRNGPHEKYDWYLIDHGNSLYGSPRKWKRGSWKSAYWRKIWRYYHTPKGLLRVQSSWAALKPMVRRIEGLSSSQIEAALRSVPAGCLRGRDRRFTKRFLLTRRNQLRGMIKRWLAYPGVKESRL
ncbi:hypothetical protein GE107_09565 [Cohnella sp. CFH 77786]|uniref:HipA family kinase n=1 Tax=Cohnella sp. CFH 77786 TaxID=2662265 RepID=UPI001C60BFF9|nr:HipA family kinase [Cohnella sp. CFH 77786]MBW5446306.1 hypothetical protein [Cohnella sp. CFH 77786]